MPDISGFTEFVQNTEVEHSHHVISELLELIINANILDMKVAEVEGDAVFFYREGELPSREQLLAQAEEMFTAFYSHLKLLEQNRICPCNACSSAPKLDLKIIVHVGDVEFITIQGNNKPFGKEVIEAHRIMKNSVDSKNYLLISESGAQAFELPVDHPSQLFDFERSEEEVDGRPFPYFWAQLDRNKLKLREFPAARFMDPQGPANLRLGVDLNISQQKLIPFVTDFGNRHLWNEGVDSYEFNQHEITRFGSEHVCIVNGKHLNVVSVTAPPESDEVVYGELNETIPFTDEVLVLFRLFHVSENTSKMIVDVHFSFNSKLKKMIFLPLLKSKLGKSLKRSMELLELALNSNAIGPKAKKPEVIPQASAS